MILLYAFLPARLQPCNCMHIFNSSCLFPMLCTFVYTHVRGTPARWFSRNGSIFFSIVMPCRPFLAYMPMLEVTLLKPCFADFSIITLLTGEFISGVFFCWCLGPSFIGQGDSSLLILFSNHSTTAFDILSIFTWTVCSLLTLLQTPFQLQCSW